jgi:PIN domain nuclease of toxin-antitoxin system
MEYSQNCFVSGASFWEIGSKMSLGKLELKMSLSELVSLIIQSGFAILPISHTHVEKNCELIFYHRDTFDRIWIAQTIVEDLDLISSDSAFLKYPVTIIWN